MKKNYLFLTCFFFIAFCYAFAGNIRWNTDFNESKQIAKNENKKIFLFFTGSDFCPWCIKFEKEILQNNNFVNKTKDTFVFQVVDFPSRKKLPQNISNQNNQLLKKYSVKGFPTIVLLNSSGKVITKLGYLPIGGSKYADKLVKIISDYDLASNNIDNAEIDELKKKYKIAQKRGFEGLKKKF